MALAAAARLDIRYAKPGMRRNRALLEQDKVVPMDQFWFVSVAKH